MTMFDLLAIPDLLDAKNVLCVQPHPDDMDVSCGGTLARLADAGARITYLTVTDGGAGSPFRTDEQQLADVRRREQKVAGQHIGVSDYIWFPYRDADYLDGAQLQDDIIQAIRRVRPDTVVTVDPWLPYEAHPAHRNVGLCTAAAALFSNLPNISPSKSSPHPVSRIIFSFTAKPNTYIDVTATWSRKIQAIRSHVSQFPDESWPFFNQYFEAKATQYGQSGGTTFAEALKVLSPMHLHCNVDAAEM